MANVDGPAFLAHRAAAVGTDDLAEFRRAEGPGPAGRQDVFRRWIDFDDEPHVRARKSG